jgi:hypothetical protein
MRRSIALLTLLTGSALTACNTAPTGAGAALLPEAPTTVDDLVLELTEATDEDRNDVVEHVIEWSLNGTHQADLDGEQTVPADLTTKGDEWTVEVTPRDDKEAGVPASASVVVVNTLPVATVTLSPDPVTSLETIQAAVESTDADGDTITHSWSWSVDGQATGMTGPQVPSGSTERGQVWEVTVVPHDGEAQGEPVSASIEVSNTPPEALSATVSPSEAYEDTVLTATGSGDDPDGDEVTVSFDWIVDGASVGVPSDQDTLDGTWFDKGQSVQVAVTVNDGVADSEPLLSDAVVILNTAPEAPTVTTSPSAPTVDDDLVCVPEAFDLDSDALTYVVTWTLDGVAWAGSTSTTTFADDTIPSVNLATAQEWACTAVPDDGEATGPSGVSEGAVIRGPLTVDGTTEVMAEGSYYLTDVSVINGGTLQIEGLVEIYATSFLLDGTSLIDGFALGSAADSGSGAGTSSTNGGAGGGGYGAAGGDGGHDSSDTVGSGGVEYGDTTSTSISAGSGGGSASSSNFGGAGGAGLYLYAADIEIAGVIDVTGADGDAGSSRNSGGGSGGGILVWGDTVLITGDLYADGGAGGDGSNTANDGGGGGAGGRVKVFYDTSYSNSGTWSVLGGGGGLYGSANYGADGGDGTTDEASTTWPG